MAGKDVPVSPLAPKRQPKVPAVPGVRFATAEAGIRYKGRTDVLLVLLDEGSQAAGVFTREWACGRTDAEGMSFGAALEAIGECGGESCGQHPLSAFFELHIEQGPLLEAERLDIGAVTGVQGMRWFEITVIGQEAHTGATPMHLRKNALVGAARLVEKVEAIARAHAPLAVATVGSMRVTPNSPNVVPGEVFLTVDLRHPEPAVLEAASNMTAAVSGARDRPLDGRVAMVVLARP